MHLRLRRDPGVVVSVFELIREGVDLVAVADRHLDLVRSGNTVKCRCPYPDHEDKDPSFYLYPDRRFHCYGCGRHGDVVDFWAVVKGLRPGIEAALDLAQEYGICLPQLDPEARRKFAERRDTEARYAAKAKEAHERLSLHPEVAAWWDGRGFCEELRKRFTLGTNKGGTEALIPFWSRGRVQGLIRRKLEGKPKYVLPRAEDFPDGRRPLFVPGGARGEVFLVEGYVDALVLVALGFDAVAVGGT
ncbi:MAG: CHC2 zinc finger domain-containing protein, partial [Actinomycetota bacterium]|nr:CHC2 zinc finger domain-containing protein [Actinomycetota bacterium]